MHDVGYENAAPDQPTAAAQRQNADYCYAVLRAASRHAGQPVPTTHWQNPSRAEEVAAKIPMLSAEAVADALAAQANYYATAFAAKQELDAFLAILLAKQPASVGGKLPNADFYANPNSPEQ